MGNLPLMLNEYLDHVNIKPISYFRLRQEALSGHSAYCESVQKMVFYCFSRLLILIYQGDNIISFFNLLKYSVHLALGQW